MLLTQIMGRVGLSWKGRGPVGRLAGAKRMKMCLEHGHLWTVIICCRHEPIKHTPRKPTCKMRRDTESHHIRQETCRWHTQGVLALKKAKYSMQKRAKPLNTHFFKETEKQWGHALEEVWHHWSGLPAGERPPHTEMAAGIRKPGAHPLAECRGRRALACTLPAKGWEAEQLP